MRWYRYVRYLRCMANGVWMAVIKWYGFRMLTKLRPLQVENQLENNGQTRVIDDICVYDSTLEYTWKKSLEIYKIVNCKIFLFFIFVLIFYWYCRYSWVISHRKWLHFYIVAVQNVRERDLHCLYKVSSLCIHKKSKNNDVYL